MKIITKIYNGVNEALDAAIDFANKNGGTVHCYNVSTDVFDADAGKDVHLEAVCVAGGRFLPEIPGGFNWTKVTAFCYR